MIELPVYLKGEGGLVGTIKSENEPRGVIEVRRWDIEDSYAVSNKSHFKLIKHSRIVPRYAFEDDEVSLASLGIPAYAEREVDLNRNEYRFSWRTIEVTLEEYQWLFEADCFTPAESEPDPELMETASYAGASASVVIDDELDPYDFPFGAPSFSIPGELIADGSITAKPLSTTSLTSVTATLETESALTAAKLRETMKEIMTIENARKEAFARRRFEYSRDAFYILDDAGPVDSKIWTEDAPKPITINSSAWTGRP